MHRPISRNTWYSLFGDPDRYPHYVVGGKPYFSKFDAMVASRELLTEENTPEKVIRFKCFDDALAKFDFSQEPRESYQELCKQHALSLRQKYDYIRVWYSGGVDSHTALMSFYRAGVEVDEICSMSNKAWDTDELGVNIEYELLTKPTVNNQLRKLFPRAKIREIVFGYDYWSKINTVNFHDILYKASINYLFGRDIPSAYEIQPDLMDAVEKHPGKMCELTGEPKVYLFKKNGQWWTTISDFQMMNMLAVPNLEMFHLNPDDPRIYIKQCHMVMRGFEKLMENKPESHSIVLDEDMILKNKLMERRNEFDLAGINAIDTTIMKYRDHRGDRISSMMNSRLMHMQDHTSKVADAFENILGKEIPDYLNAFAVNADARLRDMKPYRTIAHCLNKKKSLPTSLIWRKGYGNYE